MQIRTWFRSPPGEQVLREESAILEQLLGGMFGYHLLQVSVQQKSLYGASPVQHKIALGLTDRDGCPLVSSPEKIPLANDAVDVVLVHHLLDFADSPQLLLRELSRIVLPMGHLVIVGFNPFSLWGLMKPLASLTRRPPWTGHFISPGRLMDWMNLLNFRIDRAHFCHYGLPLPLRRQTDPDYSRGLSRKTNWPLGAVYIIVARKQVGAMTPRRPVWKRRAAFGELSVVRTASRDILGQDEVGGTD